MKPSITIAGSIIVDKITNVDTYPERGMCSRITSEKRNIGGCVCNTACDLALIDSELPVKASGVIGNDDDGNFSVLEMKKYGVDCTNVRVDDTQATSHAVVICDEESTSRTFLTCVGTNALYGVEDVGACNLQKGDFFHVGYLYLLNSLDAEDSEFGTVSARCLNNLQKMGVKTSIDMISVDNAENAKKVKYSLKYCDNVIINEIEGGMVVGIEPRINGEICDKNVMEICKALKTEGVKDRVIIHCPERAYCYDGMSFTTVDSLKLPSGWIKSSVGAGDAFCAGALYGIYKGWEASEILSFANCAAACSLAASDSISGMKQCQEIKKMMI